MSSGTSVKKTATESVHKEPCEVCEESWEAELSTEASTIEIVDLLHPEKIETTYEFTDLEYQSFIQNHDILVPLIENRPQYYSSSSERRKYFPLRTANTKSARKRALQRRTRIIILVDIILFIMILGVIYPSLRKLQSTAKLNHFRFSLSLKRDSVTNQIQTLLKVEGLKGMRASSMGNATVRQSFLLTLYIDEQHVLLKREELTPPASSPIAYYPYSIVVPNGTEYLYAEVEIEGSTQQMYLQVPSLK